jgi:hypothetical protein
MKKLLGSNDISEVTNSPLVPMPNLLGGPLENTVAPPVTAVYGTNGNDFFHVEGDRILPPPGYNNIVVSGGGEHVMYTRAGDDLIYCDGIFDP